LIDIVKIDYQNNVLIVSYKYPFSTEKTVDIPFDSFSFCQWRLKHYSLLITIKSQDFKLTIREGDVFGLDTLDFVELKIRLDRIFKTLP
jgi:hypothetical protein